MPGHAFRDGLGGGVIQSGASDAVLRFAEKASVPAAITLMGLGAIPADHPLSPGMLGMHAARCTNMVLEESDLLIAAGVRFDDRATGNVPEFCRNARVIHIDIDSSETGKLRTANVGIRGDVRGVLESLLPGIDNNLSMCGAASPSAGCLWKSRSSSAPMESRDPFP